jgi:hypothetical protein
VLEARHISFLCIVLAERPGVPLGTMKQVNSGSPFSLRSLTACTITPSVMSVEPLVMKILEPSMTQVPSAFRIALVREPRESEPASGSVRPKAKSASPPASLGSHSFFCASVPKYRMGAMPSDTPAATVAACEPSTRASSSTAMQ